MRVMREFRNRDSIESIKKIMEIFVEIVMEVVEPISCTVKIMGTSMLYYGASYTLLMRKT